MTRGIRLEDLPKSLQEQVRSKAGLPARRRDRRGASSAVIDGHCHACGMRFDRERKWEAHVRETGHRRLELIATREDQC